MTMYRLNSVPANVRALPILQSASGSIATFDTDRAERLVSCVCEVASGNSEINVTACGKNLLENKSTTTTVNAVTFTVNTDGSISLNGTASASFQFNINNNAKLKSAKYTMSNGSTTPINGVSLFAITPHGNVDVNRLTGYVMFEDSVSVVALWITNGVNTNGITIKPMIELGTTATTYVGFNGTTYNIPFGETLSDTATYDAISGVLTRNDSTTKQLGSCNIVALDNETNNVYCDTGDTEVKFWMSIDKYIGS